MHYITAYLYCTLSYILYTAHSLVNFFCTLHPRYFKCCTAFFYFYIFYIFLYRKFWACVRPIRVRMDGGMAGWGLCLNPCRLLLRWNGTQVTAPEITCHSKCAVRPESVRRGGGVRGTDGIGATVAEPLPLIAALDKEKYLIGNQSCGLRRFEHFLYTVDRSTWSSVHLSLRGLMWFWQQMRLYWRFKMTCQGIKNRAAS